MNRLIFFLVSFFISASAFADFAYNDACIYPSAEKYVSVCNPGDQPGWVGISRYCRKPGLSKNGVCVPLPGKCPSGEYSSGLYDYGTDHTKFPPSVACAGGCNVVFSGSAPAYSRLINGVTHYYAQGSYDYMGGDQGQCSGSDIPSSVPSLPSDSCPSGEAFDPVTRTCKPVDSRECPPGQTHVNKNGVTSCVSGPCPEGTTLGEFNGKPICLGGGEGEDGKEEGEDGKEGGGGSGGGEGEDGKEEGEGGKEGGGGSGGGEGEDGDDKDEEDSEKSGLKELLGDFLKHKTYSKGKEGSFVDLSDNISRLKLDFEALVKGISSDASKLISDLPEGVGSLPCESVNAFGTTLSICLQKYASDVSAIGAIVIFVASVAGAGIIFRG